MPLNHAVAWIDHHSAQVLQFDAVQVHDEKIREHVRRDIVRALIDEQTLALDALSATYGGGTKARVELVWSAGTLGNSDWANELHPKPNAFNRLVGECWRKSARKAMGLP